MIAYDRAGYGQSDPAPLDLDLQIGDLVAILEEAGPDPCVVAQCRSRCEPRTAAGRRLSVLSGDRLSAAHLSRRSPDGLDHLDAIAESRSRSVWPQVPVVVLTATRGKPEVAIAQATATQDRLIAEVGGKHIVVPDAGHYIQLDRPDLVVQAIRDVSSQR